MFFPLNKPPQWLLDGLFAEHKSNGNFRFRSEIQEAYNNKYVVYDTASGEIMFDLNRVAFVRGGGIPKDTSDKDYAKYESSGWPFKLGGEGWR